MYKKLTMKGGNKCMCDIEKVYQILKRECQCDENHINKKCGKVIHVSCTKQNATIEA